MSDIKQLKELASEEIARRQARLMPFNWDPEPEDVLALIEVAEAARTYYTRYAQDEADDGEYSCAGNGGQMTGCSDQQGKDALALRGALSRLAAAESRQGGETS